MPLYRITRDAIEPVQETRLGDEGIRERQDLQRWLRDAIYVIAPNVLVIDEEFGDWEDSRRRIDLLGVDKAGNLVVIELKRADDHHMELQALRYAAMISTMTFEQVVDTYARYLIARGQEGDARELLLEHLGRGEPDEDEFAQDVRIVLVAGQFSRELTSAVLWMNDKGLDIRCVRIQPYKLGSEMLLDVQPIIPLPEAEEYQVRIREKEARERQARQSKQSAWTGYYYVNIGAGEHRAWEDCRRYGFVSAGYGTGYSDPLKRLKPGDKIFAYQKGHGYVGFGVVRQEARMARDFDVPAQGKRLFDLELAEPGIKHDADDPELAEWVVGVDWHRAYPLSEAKRFKGAFANQNIVCKLTEPTTLEFLEKEFDVASLQQP